MLMYRTGNWDNTITERIMSKTTDKSVFWINSMGKEERESRISKYSVWHETKEEAVAHLKNKWSSKIRTHENEISRYKKLIFEIE